MRQREKLILLTNALRKVKDDFKPKKWFDFSSNQWRIDDKPFIMRPQLREMIMTVLKIGDAHTVNNWVTILLGKQFIQPNPHTNLSKSGKVNPSNYTRYYITVTPRETTLSQTNLSTYLKSK